MFKKILIANRGEIACRVIKTARKLGISTVAVYSEADKNSLHVAVADEAVCLGPAAATESYLSIDRIIEACHETQAEAVHPGYGFLSENPQFPQRLLSEGIVFIGPNSEAMSSMGDKIASKQLARQAGVNTIPGNDKVLQDAEDAVRVANDIGYPVMLKASAGGGGKGMRVVYNDEQCRHGFARATNEARSSFGDERILAEKFITQPRHIEIQVLGDHHGNIIHLGERECSLQRRHQKVIEEAPSPFLDDKTRQAMGKQAVALAKAVGYHSAGTVEFLVDADRNFYFLEMNTRLQVEHPVTEFVTGLDLVEWMIRIAAGEKLTFSQSKIVRKGWALETRVYAEDPFRHFLPSAGRLVRYLPPTESDNVRVDTGVTEGGEVSIHYDPMIAKVITHAKTRDQAIAHMRDALNEFCIRGIAHNIIFLGTLIDHPRFTAGQLSTNMIAEEFPEGFNVAENGLPLPELLISVCGVLHRRFRERAAILSDQLPGYEPVVAEDWVVVCNGKQFPISVQQKNDQYTVQFGKTTTQVATNWHFGQLLFRAEVDGSSICVQVERHEVSHRLSYNGTQADMMVISPRAAELLALMPAKEPSDTSKFLLSPMPGLLASVAVAVGDEVKPGQHLAIVEAMKMENVLCAEREGRIAKLHANVGETLGVDQPILEYD